MSETKTAPFKRVLDNGSLRQTLRITYTDETLESIMFVCNSYQADQELIREMAEALGDTLDRLNKMMQSARIEKNREGENYCRDGATIARAALAKVREKNECKNPTISFAICDGCGKKESECICFPDPK
jgi:hypothetical protein